ncbi:MAG: penicillin acylase family protein [Candidatus Didemnitutus sp.]|nr:penicillin acylase family protein [Candidatus Didemnitutus sp.]
MTSSLRKRLQLLLSVLSVLAGLLVMAGVFFYILMRGSLAQLDGTRELPGLAGPVTIERDALGVPLITGATRLDVARATGFLHGQERFFQMDLLRRRAAGELAEIFGESALEMDQLARRHDFRHQATLVHAALAPEHRALLGAYVAGVNLGREALGRRPWEYDVLRVAPVAWTVEDSLLCIYAMWFDLQDERGHYELATRALYDAYGGSGLAFFAPRGTEQDAALDGSLFPTPALPALRLKRGDEATTAARASLLDEDPRPGSNNFAVAGIHTSSGAGLLANDPHLGLNLPNIWYRAALAWSDATGAKHWVVGSTLPGTPAVIIGSNGHVAWGFTNAYLDTVDLVVVETFADLQYRTPDGWRDIEDRTATIAVKGGEPVTLTTRWTEWGPIIGPAGAGRYHALRWTAHETAAVNLEFLGFETTRTTDEAVTVAHRVGMPNQNLLAADTRGQIAWTVTGILPRRVGFDGRLPASWAYGDRKWNGWVPRADVPTITNPADGLLWTANNRVVGGEAYAKLGDGGYANGIRASAIRDDLRTLTARGQKITESDLLGIQLDDRAPFLGRWQELLLKVVSDEAVAKKPARGELRDLARQWNGHAAAESAGYRIIRGFRLKVAERTLAPFAVSPKNRYERFGFGQFKTEDAVWRLIHEQPLRLLNPNHRTWDSLLLAAVDDVIEEADQEGTPLRRFTWGARNRLRMQHPFSRFVPAWLGSWLNAPTDALPGDTNTPRVQTRTFGASMRLVVTPGREAEGILHMPGGQSGHPLSPFYRAGHSAWVKGEPRPLLPGPATHTLRLTP